MTVGEFSRLSEPGRNLSTAFGRTASLPGPKFQRYLWRRRGRIGSVRRDPVLCGPEHAGRGRYVDRIDLASAFALPFAFPGSMLMLYNNTANNCTIYPGVIANNSVTAGAQDTINNTTSLSLNSHAYRALSTARKSECGLVSDPPQIFRLV